MGLLEISKDQCSSPPLPGQAVSRAELVASERSRRKLHCLLVTVLSELNINHLEAKIDSSDSAQSPEMLLSAFLASQGLLHPLARVLTYLYVLSNISSV